MPLHIAICDDHSVDAEYVKTILCGWGKTRDEELWIEQFSSAEKFLFHYEDDRSFDILMLDIEMDGMDGVTMARRVRKDNEAVQIVFITGYSDYIAEGYDVAALHYLMKPVSPEKLCAVLDRAAEKCRQNGRFLLVEYAGTLARIPLYEIRYLDVHQNYVTIHAKQDYTLKRPLSEFEKELGDGFFRVGRGMILNLKEIRRVSRTDVYLADGSILPLPRGAYESLNRAIIRQT